MVLEIKKILQGNTIKWSWQTRPPLYWTQNPPHTVCSRYIFEMLRKVAALCVSCLSIFCNAALHNENAPVSPFARGYTGGCKKLSNKEVFAEYSYRIRIRKIH